RDRLAIRNLRWMKDDVDAVLLVQLRDDDLHVQLTLAGEEELLRLRIACEADRRIFLDDARNGGAELVFIAARFRLDGECDRCFGILNRGDEDLMILRRDRVARMRV